MVRFRRFIDVMTKEETQVPYTAEEEAAADAAEALDAIPKLDDIKAECKRRIYAVAKDTAQMNMASFQAAGLFTAEQTAAYVAGLNWVVAMRQKCCELVLAADATYADDRHWPACPDEALTLAASF